MRPEQGEQLARATSRCASPTSPTGGSPTSAAKASTPATSPRPSSTSATTSRCSAASPTRWSTSGCRSTSCPSLDIFNDAYPGRLPGLLGVQDLARRRRGAPVLDRPFSEPLAFSLRALRATSTRAGSTSTSSTTTRASATACSRSSSFLPVVDDPAPPDLEGPELEMSHAPSARKRRSGRALVPVHRDAGAGRSPDASHGRGVARTRSTTSTPTSA